MKIHFLGAAGTVTGSKYLIETDSQRILVDCGLFQGLKELRLRNREKFPIAPATIDVVILTHAHLDHSGYLPVLVRDGFSGPIYTTAATAALCRILLADSGYLQEEEARLANKYGFSKHHPALPLYTKADAEAVFKYFKPVPYEKIISLGDDLQFHFLKAGHILGAASVYLQNKNQKICFSGDLGRPNDPVIKPPLPPENVDTMIIESTYGNRKHELTDPQKTLAEVINETALRQGVILIPSFAVGRAQSLLYLISELKLKKIIPDIPVYLNSPMAINATEIFHNHRDETRLSVEQCAQMCNTATYINTVEDSKKLNTKTGPMIIISASGMATGGRILHHLKAFAPDPKNTILFVGFQAAGTRGDAMIHGATEIKIHGQYTQILAEVKNIDTLSAHADYSELITWLNQMKTPPKKLFITHGEPSASHAFKVYLETNHYPAEITIPKNGEIVDLN